MLVEAVVSVERRGGKAAKDELWYSQSESSGLRLWWAEVRFSRTGERLISDTRLHGNTYTQKHITGSLNLIFNF